MAEILFKNTTGLVDAGLEGLTLFASSILRVALVDRENKILLPYLSRTWFTTLISRTTSSTTKDQLLVDNLV